jgi:hypothetical protein
MKDPILIRTIIDDEDNNWLYQFEVWSDIKPELLTARLEKVPGTLWFQPGIESMGKCLRVAVDPRYDGEQVKSACVPIIYELAGIPLPVTQTDTAAEWVSDSTQGGASQ